MNTQHLNIEDKVPVGHVASKEVVGKIQINNILLHSAISKILQERHEPSKIQQILKQKWKRSKKSPDIWVFKSLENQLPIEVTQ